MADPTKASGKTVKLQYIVSSEVFNLVYNFEAEAFHGDNQIRIRSGWRRFYDGVADIVGSVAVTADTKLVTKFCRTSEKSLSIYARHKQVPGKGWCPVKFNFSLPKPINTEVEYVFKLSIVQENNCNCGKFF